MSRMILSAFSASSGDMLCFNIEIISSVSGFVNWIFCFLAEESVPSRNGIMSFISVGFLLFAKFIKKESFPVTDSEIPDWF